MATKNKLRTLSVGAHKAFRRELVKFVLDPTTGALRLPRPPQRERQAEDDGNPRTEDGFITLDPDALLDTATFEVRQPSVGERADILKASGMQPGEKGSVNTAKMQVAALIACVFEPAEDADGKPRVGGTVPVFGIEDTANLLAQPAGSFVDVLGNKALELMNSAGEVGKG